MWNGEKRMQAYMNISVNRRLPIDLEKLSRKIAAKILGQAFIVEPTSVADSYDITVSLDGVELVDCRQEP